MRYSILVPVYNSSMILSDLLKAIEETRQKENWDLELVLVEDGSKDNSFEVIEQLAKEYHARAKGESGYTFRKLIKIAMDGIFAFSSLPIKIISITGFLGLSFSILYSIYILWVYLTKGIQSQGFLTLVLMIAFFNSLILICLGIIGEYVIKIYDETRARPYSVIEKTINISNPNS
ncbi:MAG: glycosyltransferase [Saprospiraceae bacterium]|nr:glycosyltransferase [Saprospiraceae bacterium]